MSRPFKPSKFVLWRTRKALPLAFVLLKVSYSVNRTIWSIASRKYEFLSAIYARIAAFDKSMSVTVLWFVSVNSWLYICAIIFCKIHTKYTDTLWKRKQLKLSFFSCISLHSSVEKIQNICFLQLVACSNNAANLFIFNFCGTDIPKSSPVSSKTAFFVTNATLKVETVKN